MNQSMWGIFFVVIGILGIFFINLFEDITTTNDQNYYLLKETTQAAMFDSIDLATFRNEGKLKIIKEKFVENFTRRFAESTNIQKEYNIVFREIIEEPPKVTVEVGSSSAVTFTEEDFDIDIVNVLDAILETAWDGSITNPEIENCHVEFVPGYLKEVTTTKTVTRTIGYEDCNCRRITPKPPYELRYCIKCKSYNNGSIDTVCCDCGSSSRPKCGSGTRPDPLGASSYPVACKSSYTKCDKCPITEIISVPETTTEYVPPEYKVVCD